MTWTILNYVVSEPGEWTASEIAEDLGLHLFNLSNTVSSLKSRNLILGQHVEGVRGAKLFPTPAGKEHFSGIESRIEA
jgi:DNA-binding MarR family transcriptional regulator